MRRNIGRIIIVIFAALTIGRYALAAGVPNLESTAPSETHSLVENMEYTLAAHYGDRSGVYTGEIMNGLPNGQGTFTCKNPAGTNWRYSGQFVDGHISGYGEMEWETGTKRVGIFEMDIQTSGALYNDNGILIYEGLFIDGQAPPLNDDEIDIMLVNPDLYIDRLVKDMPVKMELKQKDEELNGYIIVCRAGLLDLSFVSFFVEDELYVPVDDFMFVSGTVGGKVATELGGSTVILYDANVVDPATTLIPDTATITLNEFNKMQEGMSYRAAAYIIGGEGELLSKSGSTQIYAWNGEGSIGANAIITFQGNQLLSKSQTGLE